MSASNLSKAAALSVTALGVLAMAAWMFGLRAIVQLHSGFAPIQFNTALCMALAGLALIRDDRAWRPVTLIAAALLVAISATTLLQYVFGIDLGIDQLLVDARFATAPTLLPGRMSQQTATAALIVGGILLSSNFADNRRTAAILGIGGCVVGCYAVTSALGYPSAANYTNGWLGFTRVSPQAAAGFFLIASSMIFRAWSAREDAGLPEWVVPAAVTTSWIVGLLLFVGVMQLQNAESTSTLPFVMLAAFMALGLALGAALVQYRRAAVASQEAIAGKARIETLLARMVRSELVASLALENTKQGVWDLNLVTGLTTADEGFRKILGRDPAVEPMRDETWTRSIHPDDVDGVRARLRATVEAGDLYDALFRVKVGAEWIWIDSRGRVVERDDAGKPLRMVGTIRDVTEQQHGREQLREAEAALRDALRIEAVGRLAGGVAHHINNQMTVVMGRADLLLDMAPTPLQRSSIESISRAAHETAEICRQLLAHGRRQLLRPAAFDVERLIGRLESPLRDVIGSRARLELSLGANAEPCFADATQIEWVIRKLVEHAREASGENVAVRICTKAVAVSREAVPDGVAPGRYVSISVSDNGPALTAEAATHVFEPFFATKELDEARGLGLATCYGILKQSNGHLSVESTDGRGTTFTLMVPCAPLAN